ncbi:methylmalonyl-CoA mutase, partial [Lysobacter sp. 2RAB21]
AEKWSPQVDTSLKEPRATVLIPGARVRYLAEIAEQGRSINRQIESQSEVADRAQSYWQSLHDLEDPELPKALNLYAAEALLPGHPHPSPLPQAGEGADAASNTSPAGGRGRAEGAGEGTPAAADRTLLTLRQRYNDAVQTLSSEALKLLRDWPQRLKSITDD